VKLLVKAALSKLQGCPEVLPVLAAQSQRSVQIRLIQTYESYWKAAHTRKGSRAHTRAGLRRRGGSLHLGINWRQLRCNRCDVFLLTDTRIYAETSLHVLPVRAHVLLHACSNLIRLTSGCRSLSHDFSGVRLSCTTCVLIPALRRFALRPRRKESRDVLPV